jgi:hypothetical protein
MWHPHLKKKFQNDHNNLAKEFGPTSTFIQLKEDRFLSPSVIKDCKCRFVLDITGVKDYSKMQFNNLPRLKELNKPLNNPFEEIPSGLKLQNRVPGIVNDMQKTNVEKDMSFLQINNKAVSEGNANPLTHSEGYNNIQNLLKSLNIPLHLMKDDKGVETFSIKDHDAVAQRNTQIDKSSSAQTDANFNGLLKPKNQELNKPGQLNQITMPPFANPLKINTNSQAELPKFLKTVPQGNITNQPSLPPMTSSPYTNPMMNPEIMNYYNAALMQSFQNMLLLQSQIYNPFLNTNQMPNNQVMNNFYPFANNKY